MLALSLHAACAPQEAGSASNDSTASADDSAADSAEPTDTGEDPTDTADDPAPLTLPAEGRYTDVTLTMTDDACGSLFSERPGNLPSAARVTLVDSTHFRVSVTIPAGTGPQIDCETSDAGGVTCSDVTWVSGDTNREHFIFTAMTAAFHVDSSTSFTHEQLLTVTCDGPTIDGYNDCGLIATDLGTSWPCSARMSATFSM